MTSAGGPGKAGKVLQDWPRSLVEVFVNLVVFPLVVELILFPVLACLVMTTALAGSNPELKAAKGPSETLTAMIGLGLVAYVLIKVITSPDLLNGTTGLRFFLPVWLSLGVLPYFYLLALYAGYDSAFRRINFNCSDRSTRRRAKWALMRRCHFRAGRWASSGAPGLVASLRPIPTRALRSC